jgi:hypothetical protein
MSRTIRRTKFNRKKHFYAHYWEAYSQQEVNEQKYIEVWKYHSDNYYTKSSKEIKQFFKNMMDRKLRRESVSLLSAAKYLSHTHRDFDIVLSRHNKHCIRWMVH